MRDRGGRDSLKMDTPGENKGGVHGAERAVSVSPGAKAPWAEVRWSWEAGHEAKLATDPP